MPEILIKQFSDFASFDPEHKTALSVRDGVLEYLGVELGPDFEPSRIYTVYRSPAQIANAAMKMAGIPITDEHVSLDAPAPNTGSSVISAEMVDASDPNTSTTIAIRNKLSVSDTMIASVASGKRELSLGYEAGLRPHDTYDYEQYDIKPHHLATVPQGRCGPMCSFLDRKPTKPEKDPMPQLHKAFLDAEGSVNLQQVVEIATGLSEAIKTVPLEKVQEVMPALQELMSISKAVGVEDPDAEVNDEDKPDPEEKTMDADKDKTDDEPGEDEKKFSDADFNKALDKKAKEFADAAIKKHAFAMEKARPFVGEDYSFADKSTAQIMRDALATQSTEKFADSEIELAFKLLKKSGPDYSNFGDQKPDENTLTARIKKQQEA